MQSITFSFHHLKKKITIEYEFPQKFVIRFFFSFFHTFIFFYTLQCYLLSLEAIVYKRGNQDNPVRRARAHEQPDREPAENLGSEMVRGIRHYHHHPITAHHRHYLILCRVGGSAS